MYFLFLNENICRGYSKEPSVLSDEVPLSSQNIKLIDIKMIMIIFD